VIGDVSGKSIPAALYGAVFSGQLRALYTAAQSPSEALGILNHNLIARYRSGNYIAVAYCRINLSDGSGILANGGMPFPFLLKGDTVTRLQLPGVPLGLMEETQYAEMRFLLEPGDTLVLVSDGATDAVNASDEFYDIDRLTGSLERYARKNVQELVNGAYLELRRFVGEAELSDDITIIALRRKK
jgi:sigma-B regulation protein RsbU (phosphoserine phosphatase)